jgi:hypothetical protein
MLYYHSGEDDGAERGRLHRGRVPDGTGRTVLPEPFSI